VTDADPEPEGSEWRRLDARMLLVHPVQEAVRFLPALLVVFVTGRSSDRSPWWDVAALAVIVGIGVSRWFTTRYRVGPGRIELRSGLLQRTELTTPADRVRTVDITATLLHRVLGLARVEVGTGSGGLTERLVLDALDAGAAQRLRDEVLRSAGRARAARADAEAQADVDAETVPAADTLAAAQVVPGPASDLPPAPERELLRFDPAWARYAPLTVSGLAGLAAIWGFAMQYLLPTVEDIETTGRWIEGLGLLAAGVGLLAGGVAIAAAAVAAYLIGNWQLRVTRHPAGTIEVTRGLFTRRATSIEEARLRGVELARPLPLRLAGAARLRAVTTGLNPLEQGSSQLCPPAPVAVVERLAADVVEDPTALTVPLRAHGAGARRRRFTRAVVPALVLVGLAAIAVARQWAPPVVLAVSVLPLLVAPWLARDRYAALGHLLTPRHLVAQAGSLLRRRDVVERAGTVSVLVRQSLMQRRVGVATTVLATGAGRWSYPVLDLPAAEADALAAELVPEARQFLVGA